MWFRVRREEEDTPTILFLSLSKWIIVKEITHEWVKHPFSVSTPFNYWRKCPLSFYSSIPYRGASVLIFLDHMIMWVIKMMMLSCNALHSVFLFTLFFLVESCDRNFLLYINGKWSKLPYQVFFRHTRGERKNSILGQVRRRSLISFYGFFLTGILLVKC